MKMIETVNASVIIPCYNSEKTLSTQLESLSMQEGCKPFEVLIVDNCSSDSTREVAQSWQAKLNLRIIDATQHQGVSYARNRGIAEARSDKLIFLDDDDAALPEYVGFCQKSLDEYPVYVSGFDPVDDMEFAYGLAHVLDTVSHKSLPYQSPLPSEQDPNWPILPGCSFGALKSVMEEIGGFDITMEPGAEDNDLAFRLMAAGYELRVQRSTTIAYRTRKRRNSIDVYYRRAKSVALLLERYNKWNNNPLGNQHPIVEMIKVLLAGVKILLAKPRKIKQWVPRFAINAGIFSGWFLYRLLGRAPSPNLGVGL
ncbi:glycosyltransferase family 2 protein [Rothia sp. 11254D007CT]